MIEQYAKAYLHADRMGDDDRSNPDTHFDHAEHARRWAEVDRLFEILTLEHGEEEFARLRYAEFNRIYQEDPSALDYQVYRCARQKP